MIFHSYVSLPEGTTQNMDDDYVYPQTESSKSMFLSHRTGTADSWYISPWPACQRPAAME